MRKYDMRAWAARQRSYMKTQFDPGTWQVQIVVAKNRYAYAAVIRYSEDWRKAAAYLIRKCRRLLRRRLKGA